MDTRISHQLWKWKLYWIAAPLSEYITFSTVWNSPWRTFVAEVFIDHGMGVVIGETAVIGNDVTFIPCVTLGGTSFGKAGKRHQHSRIIQLLALERKVTWPNHYWAKMLVLGSNFSLLVKGVPENATCVGNIPGAIYCKNQMSSKCHQKQSINVKLLRRKIYVLMHMQ